MRSNLRTGIAAATLALLLLGGAAFAQFADFGAGRRGPRPPVASRGRDAGAMQRVTWRTRTQIGDNRLLKWPTSFSAALYTNRTFIDAAFRADAMGLTSIEASDTQNADSGIVKKLDYNLTPEERAVVLAELRAAAVTVVAYNVNALPADAESRRKVFDFAKQLGVRFMIVPVDTADLPGLGGLATEFNIDVALRGDSKRAMSALAGQNARLGLAADTGAWMLAGIKPADALAGVKDRIKVVYLRDRDGMGDEGEPALIGTGAGEMGKFFAEMNRLEIRPVFMELDMARGIDPDAEMPLTIDAFEKTVQPTMAAWIVAASKTMPIRGGDKLPDDVKAKIEAAIPKAPYVTPKKHRKLLVIDACVANDSHVTIQHFNLAVELMAKKTGAFEAVFSNDMTNLQWPKIKEWDAIFLNDNEGELFPDLSIRESVLRYIREGGGIGGWHGSPWASRSWRELGELFGTMDASHRIVPAYLQLDDPKSPINKAFDGTGLEHTEEYYLMRGEGYAAFYTRAKVHVLLSLDPEKSPGLYRPARGGEPMYTPPHEDFAVAWIRKYGKGRVYYNSMGHMPDTMMSPQIMGHVLAALQYLVGDLNADDTPSAQLASNTKR